MVLKEKKPLKKTDKELWTLIEDKIQSGDYLFLPHAKMRQRDRDINDLEVLDILENKAKRIRRRNKRKDCYREAFTDWNYCIEGFGLDGDYKIRIIISFKEDENLLIITVIKLAHLE